MSSIALRDGKFVRYGTEAESLFQRLLGVLEAVLGESHMAYVGQETETTVYFRTDSRQDDHGHDKREFCAHFDCGMFALEYCSWNHPHGELSLVGRREGESGTAVRRWKLKKSDDPVAFCLAKVKWFWDIKADEA